MGLRGRPSGARSKACPVQLGPDLLIVEERRFYDFTGLLTTGWCAPPRRSDERALLLKARDLGAAARVIAGLKRSHADGVLSG
jgi:hypothetical protein